MNNRKPFIVTGVAVVIILVVLSLGTIGYMYKTASILDNMIANNVYIEDLSVGGLTKDEAKAKLEQAIYAQMNGQSILLTDGRVSKKIPLLDLNITYNIDEIINQAFQVGQDKNLWKRYQLAQKGATPTVQFKLTQTIDKPKVEALIKNLEDIFYIKPINATLRRVNHQFITTSEVNGQSLDIPETTESVLAVLRDYNVFNSKIKLQDCWEVQVSTKIVQAKCTESLLQQSQTLVASFATAYNNASPNRNANLEVACNKITTLILPDETFKLSNYLEPFTEAAGYKNAGVIINGKVEDGIGGGVCQVASTLYNAVLLTDLEIVMRQNHSLAVSYVPLGRDATYSTDIIDFRFKNNSGYPLFIEGYCKDNQVIINLYGSKTMKSNYDIKFASELIETIPAPSTIYEEDPTLEEGKESIEVKGLDGKRIKLYKLYYQNGVEVKRVLVNTSYYKPRAAVIKRGTKKMPPLVETIPNGQEQGLNPDKKPETPKPESSTIPTVPQPTATPFPDKPEANESLTADFTIIQH